MRVQRVVRASTLRVPPTTQRCAVGSTRRVHVWMMVMASDCARNAVASDGARAELIQAHEHNVNTWTMHVHVMDGARVVITFSM